MTSSATTLMGVGIPDVAAKKLGNTIRTIAGVGTAQTGAAALTVNSVIATTSGGATAFVLTTTWEIGDTVTVYNSSATTALIYPQSGGAIDGGSTDASVTITQNGSRTFQRMTSTSWRSVASSQVSAAQGAITVDSITATASPMPIAGLAAAQGGAVTVTGGASSTAGNAGGAVTLVGGLGGTTGVGGAATLTGAAGGATSGTGGAAAVTGGAGTNGNAAGGIAGLVGGAGQGTGSGAVARVVGGASGVGATGTGGVAQVTGGAALSSNGGGGSVVLTGGAKAGTGIAGGVRTESLDIVTMSAPAAKTTSVTLTAAEILGGLITANQGGAGAATYTMPLGTDLDAALPADIATGDTFQFSIINISVASAEIVTVAGNTGTTAVGNMTIAANNATTNQAWGTFRVRRTGSGTFSFYRVG